MNYIATYDERYDKTPMYSAYRELLRLSVVELVMGVIGATASLLYWIAYRFGLDIMVFKTEVKVSLKFLQNFYQKHYKNFKIFAKT